MLGITISLLMKSINISKICERPFGFALIFFLYFFVAKIDNMSVTIADIKSIITCFEIGIP